MMVQFTTKHQRPVSLNHMFTFTNKLYMMSFSLAHLCIWTAVPVSPGESENALLCWLSTDSLYSDYNLFHRWHLQYTEMNHTERTLWTLSSHDRSGYKIKINTVYSRLFNPGIESYLFNWDTGLISIEDNLKDNWTGELVASVLFYSSFCIKKSPYRQNYLCKTVHDPAVCHFKRQSWMISRVLHS